jgi:Ca-activated chloride channel family protein
MTVTLVSAEWLGLLLLLPLLAWWLRPGRRRGVVVAQAGGAPSARTALRDTAGAAGFLWGGLELLPLLLRLGALVALAIALARPQVVRTFDEPRVEGVGIALALDLSTSMWAEDMGARRSRLDVAKTTALTFIDARTDDIGLVTFAGEAFARLPLTHDGHVVKDAVEQLEVGLLTDGTDIAGAIAAGAGLLDDSPHGSKVLILVTDGAHNKAGVMPDLAARAAAAVGVTIYPVAIGQEMGRDTRTMETVLTQAARITGGRYFKATDAEALEEIYAEIDRLVQPSVETVQRIETTPYAWIFALVGLALAALAAAMRASPLGVLP